MFGTLNADLKANIMQYVFAKWVRGTSERRHTMSIWFAVGV